MNNITCRQFAVKAIATTLLVLEYLFVGILITLGCTLYGCQAIAFLFGSDLVPKTILVNLSVIVFMLGMITIIYLGFRFLSAEYKQEEKAV